MLLWQQIFQIIPSAAARLGRTWELAGAVLESLAVAWQQYTGAKHDKIDKGLVIENVWWTAHNLTMHLKKGKLLFSLHCFVSCTPRAYKRNRRAQSKLFKPSIDVYRWFDEIGFSRDHLASSLMPSIWSYIRSELVNYLILYTAVFCNVRYFVRIHRSILSD